MKLSCFNSVIFAPLLLSKITNQRKEEEFRPPRKFFAPYMIWSTALSRSLPSIIFWTSIPKNKETTSFWVCWLVGRLKGFSRLILQSHVVAVGICVRKEQPRSGFARNRGRRSSKHRIFLFIQLKILWTSPRKFFPPVLRSFILLRTFPVASQTFVHWFSLCSLIQSSLRKFFGPNSYCIEPLLTVEPLSLVLTRPKDLFISIFICPKDSQILWAWR